ncbi:amidohydrolase family protein [Mangrovicoccus algicola]|uniref:Amidohydrolase family protein n=1 Tax=Mangrovicoccus algicola TaxID=2771008 RepID=A0A8J6YVT5_9RHOB|nr:amidohydrolase family protein [Mangrovicoccus algicola]MBE3638557.1 amidohydrolase family protein [Mangrovicoccus algicola]
MFDLILRRAALDGIEGLQDLGLKDGRIAAIAPRIESDAPATDLEGRFLSPGLCDAHVHLDKACILDRCPVCEGTLAEAVALTAAAKPGFTEEDVYARGAQVLERAIAHGTQRMRSFVEVDPRAGLRSLAALLRLRADYAAMIDLQICAFAQEGLTQEMATYELLEEACRQGADMVGGCPYTDPDPAAHVRLILDLAERHGMRADFHLDFDLNPAASNLPHVLREVRARGLQGRVSIGHVTQISAMSPARRAEVAESLAAAGIALTVLPATDLFLTGREADRLVPRGVTAAHRLEGVAASLATNNVLNPFTPFGDASLVRMANLYANVVQAAGAQECRAIWRMVTCGAAEAMGARAEIAAGAPADLVLLDAPDAVAAIREAAPVLAGWKAGRPSFRRPRAELLLPRPRPGGPAPR